MIPAYTPQTKQWTHRTTPTRGRNKPLKATWLLVSLILFASASMTALVAHTWNFYDRLHITGWTSYSVQAGDTLSSLAAKYDPTDYQPTVQQAIEKENHMSSSTLLVGQVVQVPVVRRNLP